MQKLIRMLTVYAAEALPIDLRPSLVVSDYDAFDFEAWRNRTVVLQ